MLEKSQKLDTGQAAATLCIQNDVLTTNQSSHQGITSNDIFYNFKKAVL
jgi:hypothetical protein